MFTMGFLYSSAVLTRVAATSSANEGDAGVVATGVVISTNDVRRPPPPFQKLNQMTFVTFMFNRINSSPGSLMCRLKG